ncbi:endonuclease domain-containing protein [Micromonospora sp. MS34]|uniref:endonuclease domain-containing protein n=1 Tax=Micromonospora sp. MS34 TaxID=3385971 RepID=UPI00399F7056
MPRVAHRPDALAWQVFRGSGAVRAGLLTEHQLRSSTWIRLRHDVYADARLARDHGLACRAVTLRAPAGTRIAGPSAAYLHGVEHAASFTDDVHVLAPAATGLRSQRGLRVHTVQPRPAAGGPPLDPAPRAPGIRLENTLPIPTAGTLVRSDPATAAWETAVWLEPVRAVGIVDTLLARGLTTRAALAEVAVRTAGRTGGKRAGWVFGLADAAAQSPPESHLRVRLVLAGLPRPVAQYPVRLSSGLVLHPDLAWPDYRVAVEYDGRWHADADQLHRDRQQLNLLVGTGWLVLHVTSRRMERDLAAVVREVRAALVSRGWRRRPPGGPR